ncbi:NUDIX domain-containing protein [Streptomyces sp. NPDC090036]|uniref:NUDIX domain-containing protein n=1 Tax=Streptomyces sp. NPDC090036 TaxID=3365926 RepID=UPI0038038448
MRLAVSAEAGESWEQAVVRETREERGLSVAACEFLGERVYPASGWRRRSRLAAPSDPLWGPE